MTYSGVHRRKLPDVSRQAPERENHDGQVREPNPHGVGVQIPCCIYTQVSSPHVVRRTAQASWGGVPETGAAEREPDRRRSPDAGSRTYDDCDTAEVSGVAGCGIHQGEERNSSGAGIWREEVEPCGATFLSEGVFRIYDRSGRSRDPRIHSTPGGRRQATRSNEPVVLTDHCYGGPKKSEPRQRPRIAASSGSQPKAHGFAGGY